MQILISILLLFLAGFTMYEQGTMSTDNTPESRASASLSGVKNVEPIEAQEEEVKIEDDEYDENSPQNIKSNTEIDEEKMEEYQNEVHY